MLGLSIGLAWMGPGAGVPAAAGRPAVPFSSFC